MQVEGGIYLFDVERRRGSLVVHHGVSPEFLPQVGTIDVDQEAVKPAASYGFEKGYLSSMNMRR